MTYMTTVQILAIFAGMQAVSFGGAIFASKGPTFKIALKIGFFAVGSMLVFGLNLLTVIAVTIFINDGGWAIIGIGIWSLGTILFQSAVHAFFVWQRRREENHLQKYRASDIVKILTPGLIFFFLLTKVLK